MPSELDHVTHNHEAMSFPDFVQNVRVRVEEYSTDSEGEFQQHPAGPMMWIHTSDGHLVLGAIVSLSQSAYDIDVVHASWERALEMSIRSNHHPIHLVMSLMSTVVDLPIEDPRFEQWRRGEISASDIPESQNILVLVGQTIDGSAAIHYFKNTTGQNKPYMFEEWSAEVDCQHCGTKHQAATMNANGVVGTMGEEFLPLVPPEFLKSQMGKVSPN